MLIDGAFDLAHAHLDYAMVLSALATRRLGVPFILTLHSGGSELCERGGLRRHLVTWAARRADLVIACGDRVSAESPLAQACKGVAILANPAPEAASVDAEDRTAARGILVDGDPALAVVSVSRLVGSKNVDRVIDAVAVLRDRGVDVAMAVIGDGPERDVLEHRAPPTGVRFLGQRDDVAGLLAGADVLVCPFDRNEGMPMSVLEAMASGLVVVASSSGDMGQVLADGRGIVIEPATVDAIASALAPLAEQPALRRAFGAAARSWVVEERSPHRWAQQTIDRYHRVLEARRAVGDRRGRVDRSGSRCQQVRKR